MKTSVELNDQKVMLAKKLSSAATLKDLLDQALDAYIARARRHSLADLLGTDFFEGKHSRKRVRNGRSHR
jgi:hypothetical protein